MAEGGEEVAEGRRWQKGEGEVSISASSPGRGEPSHKSLSCDSRDSGRRSRDFGRLSRDSARLSRDSGGGGWPKRSM